MSQLYERVVRPQTVLPSWPDDLPDFMYLSATEQSLLLRSRATGYERTGIELGQLAAREHGASHDITRTFGICNAIISPLNKIFISQFERAHESWEELQEGETPSWSMYNPVAARELKQTVADLTSDTSEYAEFFSRNIATKHILQSLAFELVDEKSPERLGEISRGLEQLAIDAYQHDQPVFLFCMGASYTSSDPNVPQDPRMLEADLRVILPLSKEEREESGIDDILELGWQELLRIHRDAGFQLPDIPYRRHGILGNGFFFAGSQIVERTESEKFSSDGYHISLNMLEDVSDVVAILKTISDVSNITDEALKLRVKYLIAIFNSFHEESHEFTKELHQTSLEEVGADAPAASALLRLVLSDNAHLFHQNISVEEVLAMSLGVNTGDSLKPITGQSEIDESYRICSKYILMRLMASGFISVSQEGNELSRLRYIGYTFEVEWNPRKEKLHVQGALEELLL